MYRIASCVVRAFMSYVVSYVCLLWISNLIGINLTWCSFIITAISTYSVWVVRDDHYHSDDHYHQDGSKKTEKS